MGRLSAAAMALYVERGFEQTTVAEIAERAGLTARTFFRYYTDKREVLFAGSAMLGHSLVTALDEAPASATPMDAVWVALDAAAKQLGARHEHSRLRQTVIAANPELQEREHTKMASLSLAIADGLRRRGVEDRDARLAGEVGISVLRVSFDQWVSGPPTAELAAVMRASFDQMRVLTGTP